MSSRNPKRAKSTDLSWIKWHARRGVSWVHNQGYRWVKDRYVPALKRLEQASQSRQVKEILVDGYFVLGDVHDFNSAPMQAVKAYRKSIKYFPDPDFWSEPWREMGNMYSNVGRYDEAIKCLKRALRINPANKFAIGDLEVVEYDIKKMEIHSMIRQVVYTKLVN